MRNDDGSTKTGANADHCLAEAKDAYESARADGTNSSGYDHWYDEKLGALLDSLDEYRKKRDDGISHEQAVTAAKKYHKEVAMASKSDWNDDDFDALSKVEDKPMQLEKGSEVDVKVSMTGMTTAKMQESKPNIEKAVKNVFEASPGNANINGVACSEASASGTKQTMSCRVKPTSSDPSVGESLQNFARRPNFANDLKVKFNSLQRRRRLNGRALDEAATMTTEASQTYSFSADESPSPDSGTSTTGTKTNSRPTTGASPSGSEEDDEQLLSSGERSFCSSLALVLLTVISVFLI